MNPNLRPGCRRQTRQQALESTFAQYDQTLRRLAGLPDEDGLRESVDDLVDVVTAAEETNIDFLSAEDIVALHAALIRRYTPGEPTTSLYPDRRDSAVMAPQQTFGGQYLHPSLAAMAAAYLVGLGMNHSFINGNKRVAFAAASVFLRINGFRLILSQAEAEALTMNVVTHRWEHTQAADVIENGVAEL